MIIVTGGAGFIGSNLVKGLNNKGREDIILVDDLTDGSKFRNLVNASISDYWDIDELQENVKSESINKYEIDVIFHQGACAVTTEWDGRYMMDNNYAYSRLLLHYCANNNIPFIYASSAAVYGVGARFTENEGNEAPVNIYGYSKYLFDEYVAGNIGKNDNQVAGLRYFNVYGPGEQHKGAMASVAFHFNQQLKNTGTIRLFKGSGGYTDGEQRRDFVYINDIVNVNLWFMENREVGGIFNIGTGASRSFNDVAKAVINWHGKGEIEYIEFPDELKGCYQSFTEADINLLRNAGYGEKFVSLESGIKQYLDIINS